MSDIIITIITAAFATLGFAMILNVNVRLLPFAFIGGIVAMLTYLVGMKLSADNLFLSNLLAAFVATLYSEICAVVLKAPATVFLLPCNVSLVPGGGLYYTMQALLLRDREAFVKNGSNTLSIALGIAAGIIIASILVHATRRMVSEIKYKTAVKNKLS